MTEQLSVRPAVVDDIDNILEILDDYAAQGLLLKRTREDLQEKIGNFRVGLYNGRFACCCALRDFGDDLYEVRSLAVKKEFSGFGIGSQLVSGAIELLKKEKRPARIFALTYRSNFFCRLGFRIVSKEMFPQKIWSDCSVCPKKENCDETAVLLELK